jgi:hypothetical protein
MGATTRAAGRRGRASASRPAAAACRGATAARRARPSGPLPQGAPGASRPRAFERHRPVGAGPRAMEAPTCVRRTEKCRMIRKIEREASPLAWGRLPQIDIVSICGGNTPTRVGKTRPSGHDGHRGADAPRGGSRPLGRLDVFWAPASSRASLESPAGQPGVLRSPTAPEASHAAPRAAPGAPVASAAARVTRGIGIHAIPPGTADPHAYIDRFHQTYREEILDAYLLESLEEVRVVSERWLVTSSSERPHDSVGEFPPLMFLQRPSSPGKSPS